MIYFTGDVHGRAGVDKLLRLKREVYKKKDYDNFLVVCGDFSYVWFGDERDSMNLAELEEKLPYTLLWVDGKHENFTALRYEDKYPIEKKYGGNVQTISPHIFHLLRGEIYTVDGKKIFAMGGGASPDRQQRKEGKNWWPEEMASDEEIRRARENLEKHGNSVDIIVTHSAPYTIFKSAIDQGLFTIPWDETNEENILTGFLDEVAASVSYKHWFCGSYHVNKTMEDNKFSFVFNNLERFLEKR